MTKGQFDILLKHEDLIKESYNHGQFSFNTKDPIYFTRNERLIASEDHIYFDLSERLYEILSKLFNWYADLEMDEFKELFDTRLTELPADVLKLEYLKKKYFDEFYEFEQLIKTKPFDGFNLPELKDCWVLLIENDHLLSLINYLKFDVLNGAEIPESFPGENNFHLFENYFLSDNLKQAYKGMRIEKRIDYIKKIIEDFEKPTMPTTHNDSLLPTIDEWLFEFKGSMTAVDYDILIQALESYFLTGKFPTKVKKIKVGKTNKKRFGWALNRIYRSQKSNALPIEYLRYAKENISLFTAVEFDEQNFKKTNLYKYFTTKQV